MTIISDIKYNAYNKLIHYALETSDAFLCVSLSNPIFSVDVDEQIELAQEFLPSFKPDRKTIEYLKKKEDEKEKNTVLWVLAVIGAVAAVAGIAFAVYRFFAPDYLEDFEEDFDDDFDDYFEDEEE